MCYLAAALLRSTTCRVKTLWLVNCDIGVKGCRALAAILYYTESLENLNLSLNKIGEQGAVYLRLSGDADAIDRSPNLYQAIDIPGLVIRYISSDPRHGALS